MALAKGCLAVTFVTVVRPESWCVRCVPCTSVSKVLVAAIGGLPLAMESLWVSRAIYIFCVWPMIPFCPVPLAAGSKHSRFQAIWLAYVHWLGISVR